MSDFLVYILLIAIVLLGGFFVIFLQKKANYSIKLLLAFSGAFLLSTSVIHIIPEVYTHSVHKIGIYVLIGFLAQLFLEYYSEGIEHGHVHKHSHVESNFPLIIMISLCIHSFIEGIPLEREIHHHINLHDYDHSNNSLLIAILLHKLPVSIALMSMFSYAGVKIKKSFLYLLIFALMAPLGTFAGHYFKDFMNSISPDFLDKVLAIVLGMFLHISTTILFESEEGHKHKLNLKKVAIIILGGGLAYVFA